MEDLPVPDFRRVFDETPTPLLLLTPDLVIVHANRARLRATATTLEDTVGRGLFEVFPINPEDPGADGMVKLRASLERARDTRRPHTMAIQKYDIPLPDGSYEERYWSPRNVPVLDEHGEVVLLLHRSDDITEYVRGRDATRRSDGEEQRWRERAERVEADLFARTRELEVLNAELDRASARAELLARVTGELSRTLDADEAVARLARLVVPTLADWCIVSLVADDRQAVLSRALRDVGTWHAEAGARHLVQAYAGARISSLRNGSSLGRALTSGDPVVLATGAAERIRTVLRPGRAREVLSVLAPESFVVLPLRARGRTLGLLSLFNGARRSPMTAQELATAQEVAERVGLALDNARLYRQQRDVAEGLQRSLLSAPAEPDHVQVAVRYQPAAEAARVGGDWYDAFVQPDGSLVVAIGDVVGHDIGAAATMAQVRSLLRGIAVTTGAGPAQVLTRLDEALRTLQLDTSATAVVMRLEQTEDEAARGTTRVRWSNAGHPPPLAITPDGAVTPLVGEHPELLLGLVPDAGRTESEAVLDRGTTLLLSTDGLVERRGQLLDRGLDRLRETLEGVAGLDLERQCDEVLARMVPERHEDDVAVIAVRLHRQDRPRPDEAGPRRVPDDVLPER